MNLVIGYTAKEQFLENHTGLILWLEALINKRILLGLRLCASGLNQSGLDQSVR